jgi:uncharacterized protein YcbK (DUF882 family)
MFTRQFSRRDFLRASLAGALALSGAGTALAKVIPPAELPEGTLSLFNTHNNERLNVTFRKENGDYDVEALNALNWILRCPSNETTIMDVRTIEYLNLVDKKLGGGNEIHIISGYRSPNYNSMLRGNGRHVAKHSYHLSGRAIDIAIPRVNLDKVRRTALALHLGGVGYYPGAGFVHIDSGAYRTW